VDVSGSHGKIADGLQQVVGHIVGEARDELDPLDAGQRADAGEQVGKPGDPPIGLAILVAVDRLSQERDLLDSLVDKQPGLTQDCGWWPALLGTTDRRDDAIGTELVATHHHPDERLKRAGSHRRFAVGVIALEASRDRCSRSGVAVEADGELRRPDFPGTRKKLGHSC